jgi:hypothetical protein
MTLVRPLPRAAATARARIMLGKARNMSVILIITESIAPPL